jgi:hypothetical protein
MEFSGARPFALAISVVCTALLCRITDDSTLLGNTLYQPDTNRCVSRVCITDIIFNLLQCFRVIVNKKSE